MICAFFQTSVRRTLQSAGRWITTAFVATFMGKNLVSSLQEQTKSRAHIFQKDKSFCHKLVKSIESKRKKINKCQKVGFQVFLG